ncbi:HpcH/HpaI aldolase/citrate lyase family protein [Halomonas campaniensis]|uniref:Host specificity protein n=1 Tax=Halomonas campaniensis TaxID=213554 RepID=A0A246S4K6_9GAMM|nr:CoA ester lyase [Halomonas campaniensis]OWV31160.1 host specificity protein [Halomonas campaniensis]
MPITQQRSFLFVPATRPERITKALASEADMVIVDLEDAVALSEKDKARQLLHDYLAVTPEAKVLVRINSTPQELQHDLALCQEFSNVIGIMLPKAETCQQIEHVARCGKPVWPIIESAKGLVSLSSLVFTDGIERLTFGALDLATDLNLEPGTPGAATLLDQCRYQLVVCSRAAKLPPPIESVVPEIHDTELVESVARKAVEMGFAGMLSIHPQQIPSIHKAFTPSAEMLSWARRVLETAETVDGAFQLDGQMVDEPVISRAKSLLARASF